MDSSQFNKTIFVDTTQNKTKQYTEKIEAWVLSMQQNNIFCMFDLAANFPSSFINL
jgi:hypothetical protein